MATQTPLPSVAASSSSPAFERFAGLGSVVTGLFSLLYAVFFLLVQGYLHMLLPPIFLGLGGFLATAVALAVYGRVREADTSFALWALLLATIGGMGTAIVSAYTLATVVSNSPVSSDIKSLPTQIDPRGFLTFGVTGIAFLVFSWLIVRGGKLPRGLGYLGYANGALVILLYLGSLLTGNDTKSLFILLPGGLASLVTTPVWYLWLGVLFSRAPASDVSK